MMAHENRPRDRGKQGRSRDGGGRRLIAGLRVTAQDEALLAVVRPYLADVGSEGELAYRLWRRGLELTLAEVVGLGATLPSESSEELIARLVAQRLLLCLPLLRQLRLLSVLGIEAPPYGPDEHVPPVSSDVARHEETIDETASDAIAGLGGNDFL
jgi:hypothetical protein